LEGSLNITTVHNASKKLTSYVGLSACFTPLWLDIGKLTGGSGTRSSISEFHHDSRLLSLVAMHPQDFRTAVGAGDHPCCDKQKV
jgi:hypothetical protein